MDGGWEGGLVQEGTSSDPRQDPNIPCLSQTENFLRALSPSYPGWKSQAIFCFSVAFSFFIYSLIHLANINTAFVPGLVLGPFAMFSYQHQG